MLETELLHQQRPAGGDGGLGELELADVALGQHDALGRVGVGALAVQDEDPLLADEGEPVGEPGGDLLGDLVGGEPATRVEQADLDQLGDRVDEAGAAQAARVDVADDAELDVVVVGRPA